LQKTLLLIFTVSIIAFIIFIKPDILFASQPHIPTFKEIVRDSDVIAQGRVVFAFPNPMVILIYLLVFVWSISSISRLLKKQKKTSRLIIEILAILVFLACYHIVRPLFFYPTFQIYRCIEIVAFEDVFKGEAKKDYSLLISRSSLPYDRTSIGDTSIFFLDKGFVGFKYTNIWCGRWRITEDGIKVCYKQEKGDFWKVKPDGEKMYSSPRDVNEIQPYETAVEKIREYSSLQ